MMRVILGVEKVVLIRMNLGRSASYSEILGFGLGMFDLREVFSIRGKGSIVYDMCIHAHIDFYINLRIPMSPGCQF